MDVNWVEVGRKLAEEAVGLTKQGRLNLVRKRAHELKRSPHSVGRFLVLVEFLKQFKIDASHEERLPLGVIEVVNRMHLKDPAMARTMLDEILKNGVTYRDALKRMADLTAAIEKVSVENSFRPDESVYESILNRFENYNTEDLKFERLGSYEWCLSSVSSSWKIGGLDLALISEGDGVYTSNRGFKNLARNIFLAKNEYDYVLVQFVSSSTWEQFRVYRSHIKNNIDLMITTDVVDDGKVHPDRTAWAHLSVLGCGE